MAIPFKTWKDSPKSVHPEGYAFEVVNAVVSKDIGAYTNEPGAKIHSQGYNDLRYTTVGIFNAKGGDKIIFSIGRDGLDKIGIIKPDGTYVEKLNASLGFDINYPIDCESYYNYKGELIIAFTNNKNSPKLINLDAVVYPFNVNNAELFAYFIQPKTNYGILDNGGALPSGAWFPFYGYSTDDAITPYTAIENPIFITKSTSSEGFEDYEGCPAGTPTSKAIQINISNIDMNYSKLIVGMVYKKDGVLEAKIYREVVINSDTITVTITGSESGRLLTLEEILSSSSVYTKIKHLTQVGGVLYGAGTTEAEPINFQKYANLIRLEYTSDLLRKVDTLETSYKVHNQNNITKGYLHEEVYAFYIKPKIKGQGFGKACLISGRPPEGFEDKSFYELPPEDRYNETDINTAAKVYQIRDTSGANGKFGYWENTEEYYPNTDEFAPVDGSEDLRKKRVRHHRFPSIRTMKQRDYVNVEDYGINLLDTLGIKVAYFPPLPPELSNIVEGYVIYYAKRSVANSTVQGQSLVLYNHKNQDTPSDRRILWGGGNWNVRNEFGNNDYRNAFWMDTTKLRFHSFDLLLDKPAINPSYLSGQLTLKVAVGQLNVVENFKGLNVFNIDYVRNSTSAGQVTKQMQFKRIKNFRYITANANQGDYTNIIGEEAAVAELDSPAYDIPGDILNTSNVRDTPPMTLGHESTYLVNLMSFKFDIYSSYETQQLVSTGKFFKLTDADKRVWGGDTNIGMCSLVTMAPNSYTSIDNPTGIEATDKDGITKAIKIIRSFLTEGTNNMTLRHTVPGDELTKYYPKDHIAYKRAWLLGVERTANPNKIAYNKDYTSINDLNPSNILNTGDKFIAEDPYKIIRSRIPNAEERQSSWKVFLANDYYIIPKDKGFITNIQGFGNNLFINCESAIMITQGSEELATNTFKVVLGTGNIFERPPVELVFEENGYAGCQHKFSCLLTRFGYFFVDENRKKIFLVSNTPKDITSGLKNFFRENLKTTGDNPFREKGYTVAWDEEFSRIILSSKEGNFTRSYSPELESWTSKHIYFPTVMIGDRNSLYAINDNKTFKLNEKSVRGKYFDDVIHPTIFVFIQREQEQITLENIQWKTVVSLDGVNKKDLTFDSVLAWNSYQTSGVLPIIPFDATKSVLYNYEKTNTRRVKNEWNFNKLKDVLSVVDDKFINDIDLIEGKIDLNKKFYLKKPLSDDYVVIKLLFSNQKIGTLYPEIQLLDFAVNTHRVTR